MTKNNLLAFVSCILLAVCFSIGAVPADAQTKKQINDAQDLAKEGDKAYNKRDFELAVTKYGQAIAIVPNNGYSHFWKGSAHYQLKQYDQAISELDTAFEQGFKADQVVAVRWQANYDKKNYDAALKDLDSLITTAPNDLVLLISRGDIYIAKKAYSDALAAYKSAQAVAPNNPDVHYGIANSHYFLGNVKEQGISADAAIKGNTRYLGNAFFLLGDSYQKQRNLTEAANAYVKWVAAKPEDYTAYRRLADVYRGLGRFKDAIDILKRSFQYFPPKGETYTELGWYYSLTNRDQDAVEAARSGVMLSPGNFAAHTNLCRAYNGVKQFQLAVNSCTTALRLKPSDGETYFYLARAQDSLNKTADATRSYKRAVQGLTQYTKENPDFTDGFYLLGNALLADNQVEKAVAANKRAVELSPGFAKARYNLGITYLAQKNKPLAVEQYDELLKIDSDQAAKLKAEIDK